MSTTNRINKLKDCLLTVTESVYESWAFREKLPYIVWFTDGAGDALRANGATGEQALSGAVHLFEQTGTKESKFSAVQQALNDAQCAWRLGSIQHERETGRTHYEWIWEVC